VNHPDADRPGYDILVQARTGLMDEMVAATGGPMFHRFPAASWMSSYLTAGGILARLVARQSTGEGGPVRTSLQQGAAALLMLLWHDGDRITPEMGTKAALTKAHPGPALLCFRCSDGAYVQFGSIGFSEAPILMERLAEMGHFLDFDGLLPPPEYLAIYREAFLTRTQAEWLDGMRSYDVPCEGVQPLGSVFTDPQVIANDYVVDFEHSRLGPVRQSLAPYRIDPPSRVRRQAPELDEHRGAHWEGERRDVVPSTPASIRRPLEGVKVLDFGMFFAGPFAPLLLGDLGAEVVKVEPLTGDRMRTKGQNRMFLGAHRGKRSIALDLQNPASRPIVERLVQWADVVHHNLRMPAARKLCIDYESLCAIKPEIVYCHVSSYGHTGARADQPGLDPIAQAASGWQRESAAAGGSPVWYRFAPMDSLAATSSFVATMLALYLQRTTGKGSFVSGSLLGAAVESNSETMLLRESDTLAPYPRLLPDQSGISVGYRIYRTVDDEWVAVAAIDDHRLAALRRVAGVAADHDVEAAFGALTAADIVARAHAEGCPLELVRRDDELEFYRRELNAPSRLAVGNPHPTYGTFVQPGAFWDFHTLDLRLDSAPPQLGQHTNEVLADLGFSADEVAGLERAGVVSSVNVPHL
jgi:crotonobetainyl-CoA:carnitine CoA-transferase CaiB-like acyl-CoA transferase